VSGTRTSGPARLALALVAMSLAALPALAAAERPSTFLGLPTVLWKLLNLLAFVGLLVYLLAKPLRGFFHARKDGIARQLAEAAQQRERAAQLEAEMERRVASLEGEIRELRERLHREGERERRLIEQQGEADAARLLAQLDGEAKRRVDEARVGLAHEAADVAAELAREILEKELTAADRERIFARTLERLRQGAAGRSA
jgi:F-type H+-transporting ATPase subunit b